MNIEKFLILLILISLCALNTANLYFGSEIGIIGYITEFDGKITQAHLILASLILIIIFCIFTYLIQERIIKKNFLRISLILSLILIISSVIKRFMDIISSQFSIWTYLNTLLYILIFLVLISMSKHLYEILTEMIEEEKAN